MASKFGGVSLSRFGGITEDEEEEEIQLSITPTPDFSLTEMVGGIGETLLTLGSGLISVPYSGAKATAEEIYRAAHGEYGQIDKMVSTIKETQKNLTYMPQTEAGKASLKMVAAPFQWVEEKKKALGQWVSDIAGPEAGALAYTTPDALLMFLGTNPAQATRMKLGARELQRKADDLGLDLNQTKGAQAQQLAEVAETKVAGFKGEASPEVVKSLRGAKDVADKIVRLMYKKAERGVAGVEKAQLSETLAPMIVDSLKGYRVSKLPLVKDALIDLTELTKKPWAAVSVAELEAWRKTINRMKPATTDRTQQAALSIIKGQYDKFMEHQFINDMIVGDKTVVKDWQLARGARERVGKMFDDNAVISKLIDQKLTPEQVRGFLFGASDTGFSAQAGGTIRAIKDVIGKDSPAMKALHDDALLNILDPLLLDTPNMGMFTKRYRDIARKNRTVLKELFTDTELQDMASFARAIGKKGTDDVTVVGSLSTFMARMMVGHGIAKGQARIGITKGIMDIFAQSAGRSTRRKILEEILGYNPYMPLFSVGAPVRGAFLEAGTPAGAPNG